MAEVGVGEAKAHFSRLLRRVAAGEEIVIVRGSEPVARLVSVRGSQRRHLGTDLGMVLPDDFDAPLPDDVVAAFET